jgi:hypothetical protein
MIDFLQAYDSFWRTSPVEFIVASQQVKWATNINESLRKTNHDSRIRNKLFKNNELLTNCIIDWERLEVGGD